MKQAKRTMREKLDHNKKLYGRNSFSSGYVMGATIYSDYPKCDKNSQKEIKAIIDSYHANAKNGAELSKGFMCGVRDSANERKQRLKRR